MKTGFILVGMGSNKKHRPVCGASMVKTGKISAAINAGSVVPAVSRHGGRMMSLPVSYRPFWT